ncbi:MAG TPA: redox-sensing transcriptional repressor Rex [Bacteroidales bacterium]|nr:redox-sensing transcriptional repressor Rex [Bacteroidales bacterium]
MLNKAQTKRLQKYRMALLRLRRMGLTRVFSYTIAGETDESPEIIRKDFSQCGIRGNRRGGYLIEETLASLEKLFGREKEQNVILVGLGNIGVALVKYDGYKQSNFNLVAAFDIDRSKLSRRFNLPVYGMDHVREVVEAFDVKVAILAVPESYAQETCHYLIDCGITGILNFAPVLLKVPSHAMVNNINIMVELERLMYHIGIKQK